ncbi:MAG: PUR family DNA/RNA-binding protein [Bacteroidaceae bacterium]|nr:PUR family DNA/RNA-binding protein [Bacteroidaceae bacterium]
MEEPKKRNFDDGNDKDIVYSQAVKAGKRIYYLDVKRSRKNELFLAITESKKIVSGEGENAQFSFEKHKIFLYKEDFEKFSDALKDVLDYIYQRQAPVSSEEAMTDNKETKSDASLGDEIKIDIDF